MLLTVHHVAICLGSPREGCNVGILMTRWALPGGASGLRRCSRRLSLLACPSPTSSQWFATSLRCAAHDLLSPSDQRLLHCEVPWVLSHIGIPHVLLIEVSLQAPAVVLVWGGF